MMYTTGISLLLDLYDCTSPVSHDPDALERVFVEALQSAGFDRIEHLSHQFPVQGMTFITILQQSHAALHTWPESRFVSVDVYSCGEPEAVRSALDIFCSHFAQKLDAGRMNARFIERGLETPSQSK